MRTLEEIQSEIVESEQAAAESDECPGDQDAAFNLGIIAGFKCAYRMVKEDKQVAEILEHARADERGYVSVGNDYQDAWQSGFTTALLWAGEQFDWDEEGSSRGR